MHSLFDACLMGQGSATYKGTIFVVVGGSTTQCKSSPDGTTWTNRSMPSTASWFAIDGVSGHFVAVATSSSNAAYSTDGQTWHAATLPASRVWHDVKVTATGLAVAVATGTDKGAYSTDFGATWAEMTLPSSGSWWEVEHNGTVFCTYKDGTAAATSPDGVTWTPQTLAAVTSVGSGISGLTTYGVSFVLVCSNGVQVSSNGSSWTLYDMPNVTSWYGVAASSSRISSFSAGGSGAQCAISDDGGATWASGTSPFTSIARMAYGDRAGVFCGIDGANYSTSSDGQTWAVKTAFGTSGWGSIAWGG